MAKNKDREEMCLRLFTALMCFLILFSMQSMRLNMSVAIVCMVNHTALSDIRQTKSADKNLTFSDHNVSNARDIIMLENIDRTPSNKTQHVLDDCGRDRENEMEERKEDGPFLWTKAQRGLILNAYFWGYVVFSIPCGWLANRFSSVRILTIATSLSSILCLLTPLAAFHGYMGVIVLRALTGALAGLFHPAVQNLLAKWLPPSQLASIGSFAFSGATCGTIVTFIATGYMCKYGFARGWPSVFYVNGSFCLAVTAVWFILVREYPKAFASSNLKQEACVIKSSADDKQSRKVPWKSILTSKPVFAVFMCTAAIDSYGTVTTLYLPTYFAEVMNFRIVSNGTLSSLPYIFKSLVQFSGGFISDFLKRKTSLSVGTLRKLIVGTGKILCVVFIIAIGFMTCDQTTLAVVLMVSSLAATGFMELGVGINLIDIAGSYAGLILSIACFISHVVGLASASVTAAITSENPSRESWQLVFVMSALIVLLAFILHVCLASGQRQPWARNPNADCDNNQIEVQVPLNERNAGIDCTDHKLHENRPWKYKHENELSFPHQKCSCQEDVL